MPIFVLFNLATPSFMEYWISLRLNIKLKAWLLLLQIRILSYILLTNVFTHWAIGYSHPTCIGTFQVRKFIVTARHMRLSSHILHKFYEKFLLLEEKLEVPSKQCLNSCDNHKLTKNNKISYLLKPTTDRFILRVRCHRNGWLRWSRSGGIVIVGRGIGSLIFGTRWIAEWCNRSFFRPCWISPIF